MEYVSLVHGRLLVKGKILKFGDTIILSDKDFDNPNTKELVVKNLLTKKF